MKRLDALLRKELDGEISEIEKTELERLIRCEPTLRRERAAWTKTTSAMRDRPAPRLAVDPTANAIMARLSDRRVSKRALPFGLGSVVFAAAIAGLALLVVRPRPAPEAQTPAVARTTEPGPVEVELGAVDDERDLLVTIRL